MSTSSVLTMEMFLSLDEFPIFSGPKSDRASYHPDKRVSHFGPLILQMFSSSEALLDHIANFLKFISNTQSFWFTLNTSYNHGCHLTNRFILEPNDYKALLTIAGLGHYTRFGFAMKPTAWSKE